MGVFAQPENRTDFPGLRPLCGAPAIQQLIFINPFSIFFTLPRNAPQAQCKA
jgi:hypothetical protein